MKKVDFEKGSILSNIMQTAFPMLVAQIINLLYNIVDRIYIGRIPGIGTMALGAVGLCYPVIILITGFTNMYGMGGSPLFSMEMGRGNKKKASSILNSAFRLEVVTALSIMIICELFAGPMLLLFGATKAELIYCAPYLRLYVLGTAFSMISTGINPYINAQGYSMVGMATVTIGAVANIILDPIFIFVLGLGVNGAAIATVISQCLSCLFVLKFLFGPRNEYPISKRMKIETGEGEEKKIFPYVGDIVGLGTAPFIMQMTNSLVSIACNSVLMRFGGAMYVSVMTIISSVRQILDTPILAITDGSSPAISFNYGAKKPDRVRKAIFLMSFFAIGYTLFMWIFIEIRPEILVGIFTSDQELQKLAIRPLHLYFMAFLFQSFQYSGQTVFKALNKKSQAVFFSLFRKVIMVVPLTYALPYFFHMGTDGVFVAEPISNLIGGSCCFVTMLVMILPELKKMK